MQSSVPAAPLHYKTRSRADRGLRRAEIIPNGVCVEHGELDIRMGKCKFVGEYLCRTQEKLERVLDTRVVGVTLYGFG